MSTLADRFEKEENLKIIEREENSKKFQEKSDKAFRYYLDFNRKLCNFLDGNGIENVQAHGYLASFTHDFETVDRSGDPTGTMQSLETTMFTKDLLEERQYEAHPINSIHGWMHKPNLSDVEKKLSCDMLVNGSQKYSRSDQIQFVREFNYRHFDFKESKLEVNLSYVVKLGKTSVNTILEKIGNLPKYQGPHNFDFDKTAVDSMYTK